MRASDASRVWRARRHQLVVTRSVSLSVQGAAMIPPRSVLVAEVRVSDWFEAGEDLLCFGPYGAAEVGEDACAEDADEDGQVAFHLPGELVGWQVTYLRPVVWAEVVLVECIHEPFADLMRCGPCD